MEAVSFYLGKCSCGIPDQPRPHLTPKHLSNFMEQHALCFKLRSVLSHVFALDLCVCQRFYFTLFLFAKLRICSDLLLHSLKSRLSDQLRHISFHNKHAAAAAFNLRALHRRELTENVSFIKFKLDYSTYLLPFSPPTDNRVNVPSECLFKRINITCTQLT